MGFLESVFERRSAPSTLSDPSPSLLAALTGGGSASGKSVTPRNAMTINAVYSAVTLITDAILTVPLKLWETGEHGEKLACDCSGWTLLTEEANPEHSASELYQIAAGHLLLWGNAFLYKERNANGMVSELWPIAPDQVEVGRLDGKKTYKVHNATGNAWVGSDREVLHVRALSRDGLIGISPITEQRNQLGRQLAQEEYASRFYANDATPAGLLKVTKAMEPEEVRKTRSEWQALHGGSRNAAKIAILQEGTEFEQLSLSFGDQQFIEQSKFSVQDVARLFRVPAPILGESGGDSLTYSTTEMANTEFIRRAVMPVARRFELALKRDGDLIIDRGVSPKFDFNENLRAVVGLNDAKLRAEANRTAIDAGYKTPNEARQDEGLAPIEGGESLRPASRDTRNPGSAVTE